MPQLRLVNMLSELLVRLGFQVPHDVMATQWSEEEYVAVGLWTLRATNARLDGKVWWEIEGLVPPRLLSPYAIPAATTESIAVPPTSAEKREASP
jgi:hypothetical protein